MGAVGKKGIGQHHVQISPCFQTDVIAAILPLLELSQKGFYLINPVIKGIETFPVRLPEDLKESLGLIRNRFVANPGRLKLTLTVKPLSQGDDAFCRFYGPIPDLQAVKNGFLDIRVYLHFQEGGAVCRFQGRRCRWYTVLDRLFRSPNLKGDPHTDEKKDQQERSDSAMMP
jgi:hypothetical protein